MGSLLAAYVHRKLSIWLPLSKYKEAIKTQTGDMMTKG